MTEARRVALLARPGAALDRMRGALGDAGARIVLEADPTRIEPSVLSSASAEVVLVVLDAAIEESIDRFGSVLGDPSIEVIFEEAELALAREGWDAARWVRHLSAKLHHHGDVLPPRREAADFEAVAVAKAAEPALEPDEPATVDGYAVEFLSADDIALGGNSLDEVRLEGIELETGGVEGTTLEGIRLEEIKLETVAPAAGALDETTLDGIALDETTLDDIALDDIAFDGVALEEITLDAPEVAAGADFGALELVDLELPGTDASPLDQSGLELTRLDLVQPAYDAAELSVPGTAVEDLSFTVPSFEAPAPAVQDSKGESDRFRRDLDDLERRIASMGLVDAAPAQAKPAAATHRGAVLVMAGIGGPDAVRQLLGALPDGFARPVLVQQRLDGGRYDRLVTQMQRATTLAVKLAEPGMRASGGEVYILPAEIGLSESDDGIVFNDRAGEVLSSLPPSDSAVLLLSGADPGVVDTVLNQAWSGALVAGQAPEGCYDAAATNALIARGGMAGQPVDLARRLAERWPT